MVGNRRTNTQKSPINPQDLTTTVNTLREYANYFNHCAEIVETGGAVPFGVSGNPGHRFAGTIKRFGPRLVNRTMSAAARRAIGKAAKARWAAQRRAVKQGTAA
jgi:hypothetical protein